MSMLYAANTSEQDVSVGGTVDFGSIVRQVGNAIKLSGGNVIVNGSGYYDILVNITFVAASASSATFSVYKDGTIVPGATSTFTTAASTAYSVTIPAVIRDGCCCESTIAVALSGSSVSVTNASIKVNKY